MILTLLMIWLFLTQPEANRRKASLIETTTATLGLNVNKGKTKIMKINSKNSSPVTVQREVLDEVQSFTYLGSIVDTNGETDSDVRARTGKARAAFTVLNQIWKSREMSIQTKLHIFNSNFKTVNVCIRSRSSEKVEAEMSKAEYKWKELEAQAGARHYVRWKGVFCGLCSARSEKT